MRKHIAVIAIAAAGVLGTIPISTSAYCIGWDRTLSSYDPRYYSVGHEFRRAQFVIKAKVLKETWIGEDGKPKPLHPPFQNGYPRPWGFDPYEGAFYDLVMEHSYKGKAPTSLRVFSENATDRFWLRKGEEILAFVFLETFEAPIGKQLTLDTCGNLSSFPKAKRTEAAVLKASKPQS